MTDESDPHGDQRATRRYMIFFGLVAFVGIIITGMLGSESVPAGGRTIATWVMVTVMVIALTWAGRTPTVRNSATRRTVLATTGIGAAAVLTGLFIGRDHPAGYLIGAVGALATWTVGGWWVGRHRG